MDGTCNITMRKGACKSRVSWLWFGNGNTVDSSTRKASSFLVIPYFKPTHTHTATKPPIATTIHHKNKSKRSVLYSIRPFKSMWSPVSCHLVIYNPWGTHILIWNHPSPSPDPHFSLFPNFVFQRLWSPKFWSLKWVRGAHESRLISTALWVQEFKLHRISRKHLLLSYLQIHDFHRFIEGRVNETK